MNRRNLIVTCFGLTFFLLNVFSVQAATLTLSGTLYLDHGVTQATSSRTIKVAVSTSTVSVYSTTTNSGAGTWNITIPDGHSIGTGTPITVFVDGDALKAVTVTKASSTANITNLDLYSSRLIISHEGTSGTSTTNTDLSYYDYDNDTDILFTSNSNILNVFSGLSVFVKQAKTFAPSGNINASSSLMIGYNSTFTAPATTTVGGIANGGTLTAGSGSVVVDGVLQDIALMLFGRFW